MAISIHTYAKYTYLAGIIGRLILIVLTLIRPKICKNYLYYELVMLLVGECLAREVFEDDAIANQVHLMTVTLLFIGFNHNFGHSIFGIMIC